MKKIDIAFKGREILKAYLYLINSYDQTQFFVCFSFGQENDFRMKTSKRAKLHKSNKRTLRNINSNN